MKRKLTAVVIFSLAACLSTTASMIDDASNYTSGTWTNGSNGGSGFDAWSLSSGGGNSGWFIGTSTNGIGGDGSLDTSGQSFGMYGHSTEYADATRDFGSPFEDNFIFTIELGVNYRNGNKGFNLQDSSNADLFLFQVASDAYNYQNQGGSGSLTDLGWSYKSDSIITLSFSNTPSANTYGVSISRNDGVSTNITMDFGAEADGIKLFCGDTGGSDAENNLYFNNMSMVPEPMTAGLLFIGVGLLLAFRNGRK
jgi:hypothetical protein